MSDKANEILKLERFMPYRLSILSNKVSGIIADIYSDKFAISVTEWRIMAVLGEYPGISADEISSRTQIEKSILSRSVSKLLKRNLIERDMSAQDRRRSMIYLSDIGKSVYNDIVPLSRQYEQALMECFNAQEKQLFSHLIDKMYSHADLLEPDKL